VASAPADGGGSDLRMLLDSDPIWRGQNGDESPRSRPVVVFLHPSDEMYGSDRQLLAIVRATSTVARVRVMLPNDQTSRGPLTAALKGLGVEVIAGPLPVLRRSYTRPGAFVRWAIRAVPGAIWTTRSLRAIDPALIVTNSTAILAGPLSAALMRRNHVWWVRELVESPSWFRWVVRTCARLAPGTVIAISRAVAAWLGPIGSDGPIVLYDAVPVSRETTPLGDTPRAAFVGRMNAWKGWELFIQAAAIVHERMPSSRFLIAGGTVPGDAIPQASVTSAVRAADPTGTWLAWLGEVADARRVMRDSWVVVAPSKRPEPLGNVVLEAMSEGRAAIGTDIGGLPELIVDGETGLLVRPRDVEGLAHAIERVMSDRALAEAMGRAGAERFAADFSPRSFDRTWLALLDGLLHPHRIRT
jgi:glycosyltransferase involved in cell wall biosynthesis